jgi:Spy/CpxP family protein refolding chaperone
MRLHNTTLLIAAYAVSTWTTGLFAQEIDHKHHHNAPPSSAVSAPATPYAGQEARAIKALSASETQDLLNGKGMGLAKAAELNGYPGPMHVLELAAPLQLSAQQREATEKLMLQHKATARDLGAQLIDAERALDTAFASQNIDAVKITELTQHIGTLQATLRAEHLQTHIRQTALLQPEQIASYQSLRGYDKPGTTSQHQGH